MKTICFITHNKGKVKEFQEILKGKAELIHKDMEYAEMRSDDPREIAKEAAARLSKQLNKAVVVEYSGLFITALKDFPGTCSAYIHKRIGLEGILKLMQGINNRECFYRSAVGYGEAGKAVAFLGEEKGKIAEGIRGTNGFGHDPIFIPEGSAKTYGETDNLEKAKKFRRSAVEQLMEYLEKNKK